ncbi:two-component system LytT family response regulator [Paenibacillus sp. W4I10]|uniref:response regulator n=1 Tax=Paenibacillus sp. W4I10 TaxID=3042298 RepID=UPI002787B2B1|nr:response regulator [Paenibacillus sp. W4I10]MDQ0723525.1 two-component system LytT family response regulator [Paenibacillus sp. W4I10]
MKIILVDDEALVLNQIRRMLSGYPTISVVGSFGTAEEAIMRMPEFQPDVVFFDIHLPQLSGIEAIGFAREACPGVDIVFVTADNSYAVKAFELDAVDYLLKPLYQPRLDQTIQRLMQRRIHKQEDIRSTASYRILCFRSLRFQRSSGSPEIPKWRTAKTQALFAFLLQQRGKIVLKETLMELLWPDLDVKLASNQLYTSIYHIRQCLKQMGIDAPIRNMTIQEGYILDTSRIRIDVDEWENGLQQISGGNLADNHSELQRLLELYEGDYLQEISYGWLEDERERLRKLWYQNARSLAQFYEKSVMLEEALALYERIHDVDPYNEEDGLALIKLYTEIGRHKEAERHYHKLDHLFSNELRIGLTDKLVDWFEQARMKSSPWRNEETEIG